MEDKYDVQKEKIADVCKLPKDIVLGASIIHLMGNHEITIENYKNIMEFTPEKVLLQGRRYRICIQGKRLEISYYSKDEVKIHGHITEVRFL